MTSEHSNRDVPNPQGWLLDHVGQRLSAEVERFGADYQQAGCDEGGKSRCKRLSWVM